MLKAWCDPAFLVPRIDPHWARDILDALFALVLERVGQLVSDLISNYSRDTNPTGHGQCLQARRRLCHRRRDRAGSEGLSGRSAEYAEGRLPGLQSAKASDR